MILRDKGKMTKMLILLSILKGNKKLKDIAEDVGITMQGVSEYVKELESEGHIKNGKITPFGMEFLYDTLEEIGDFVHDAGKLIGKIRVTEAIAGEEIRKGDRVGLFMENGYIYAYRRASPSTGVAIMDAKSGEDLGVKDLQGIMDIEYGEIEVFVMPPISDGGSRKVDVDRIRMLIENNKDRKIGVFGVVPHVLFEKIGDVDFEFGAVHAAIDAYFRGLSTMLFISHELLPYTVKLLAERDVKYVVRNIEDVQ